MVRLIVLSLLAACWSSSAPHAGSTEPTTTTQPQATPPPPSSAPCVFDAANKQACDSRGPGFSYGPRPFIYCSGVAPEPGTEERGHEAARTSPCACNDEAALAQERDQCGLIPSMSPQP